MATKAQTHTLRIMNDIREFYEENMDGIYIVPEENNICFIHALVIGPPETPYENGFFYFELIFPDTYPLEPPSVKLRTTSGQTVRFSPNLYSNGKVCLSILGTWPGPSWCSSQTIASTLVSIRSLMDANPYHNEPGHEKSKWPGCANYDVEKKVSDYNNMIRHETLRVAVVQMLGQTKMDTCGMPDALMDIMIKSFTSNYHFYENLLESNLTMDGQCIEDPFKDPSRPAKFNYKRILERIVELKEKFDQMEEKSVATYDAITKKTLRASSRDVLKTELLVDHLTNIDEDEYEADASALYESESDDNE